MHLNEALLGVGKIKFTLRSYPGIFVTLIIASAAATTSNAEHVKNKQEKFDPNPHVPYLYKQKAWFICDTRINKMLNVFSN